MSSNEYIEYMDNVETVHIISEAENLGGQGGGGGLSPPPPHTFDMLCIFLPTQYGIVVL